MAHTLQDRFSQLVDIKLRATLVKKDGIIFNNRYEGDPKAGAVKIPVRDTETTVAAYSKTAGATKTFGDTTYLVVAIDKDYAVNEVIDGYEAQAVPDNLVADRLDSAGYSLALQMETDATTVLVAGATAMASTTKSTAATAYGNIVDVRTLMSKANVPADGRFLLVTPDFYALLLKDNTNFVRASALGDQVVQTGAVGKIAGFLVFEDNTLPAATIEFIAGHPNWCARVKEWQVPVRLQDLAGSGTHIGASAVQGRKIYAHKVTKSATLFKKTYA